MILSKKKYIRTAPILWWNGKFKNTEKGHSVSVSLQYQYQKKIGIGVEYQYQYRNTKLHSVVSARKLIYRNIATVYGLFFYSTAFQRNPMIYVTYFALTSDIALIIYATPYRPKKLLAGKFSNARVLSVGILRIKQNA